MEEFDMKTVNQAEWALIELVRSSSFQRVTVSVEHGKIVHFKKEESIKPEAYQAKARNSLA